MANNVHEFYLDIGVDLYVVQGKQSCYGEKVFVSLELTKLDKCMIVGRYCFNHCRDTLIQRKL